MMAIPVLEQVYVVADSNQDYSYATIPLQEDVSHANQITVQWRVTEVTRVSDGATIDMNNLGAAVRDSIFELPTSTYTFDVVNRDVTLDPSAISGLIVTGSDLVQYQLPTFAVAPTTPVAVMRDTDLSNRQSFTPGSRLTAELLNQNLDQVFNSVQELVSFGKYNNEGAQGPVGPQGPAGPAGVNGTDGTNGTDGSDGVDGDDGKGWTGVTLDPSTGMITFASDDGLSYTSADVRGADGPAITVSSSAPDQAWLDSASAGDFYAQYDAGFSITLDEISGVDTTGVTTNQVLGFDGTDWVPMDQTGGGGGGAVDSVNGQTGVVVLDNTDVGAAATSHTHSTGDITGLTTFVQSAISGSDLNDLADVSAPVPGEGHYLKHVSGQWEAAPLNSVLPSGGTAGQLLAKTDGTDYNTEWVDATTTETTVTLPYVAIDSSAGEQIISAGSSVMMINTSQTLINTGDASMIAGIDTTTEEGWVAPEDMRIRVSVNTSFGTSGGAVGDDLKAQLKVLVNGAVRHRTNYDYGQVEENNLHYLANEAYVDVSAGDVIQPQFVAAAGSTALNLRYWSLYIERLDFKVAQVPMPTPNWATSYVYGTGTEITNAQGEVIFGDPTDFPIGAGNINGNNVSDYSNGIYTVPRTGVYTATVSLNAGNVGERIYARIKNNDVGIGAPAFAYAGPDSNAQYNNGSVTVIINATAGDEIKLCLYAAVGAATPYVVNFTVKEG